MKILIYIMLLFLPVFIMVYVYDMCSASRLMYDTGGPSHAFDCLQYWSLMDEYLSSRPNLFGELKSYCRRSPRRTVENVLTVENKTLFNSERFTFVQLRQKNISSSQLLKWYAPIDTIERYELGDPIGFFFNCSNDENFWFGPYCQYTFDSSGDISELIIARLQAKRPAPDNLLSITNGTCFMLTGDECKSIICLDWREICDGKIECANGFDERHCHEMELNKCDPNTEYRCSNGQCIDKALYFDWQMDCLDYSDEIGTPSFFLCNEFGDDLKCEDHSCAPWMFSCGDGYCYDGPSIGHSGSCGSHRDRLYLQKMPPSTLILFSHLRIIYNDTKPEWLCYNETLCPYFSKNQLQISEHTLDNFTCQAFNSFSNQTYTSFSQMVIDLKRWTRPCSLLPPDEKDDPCLFFQCSNQSKCISYHQLLDGREDCANGEDERQENTCSLNLPYRLKCDNGKKCIPAWLVFDFIKHCADGTDESFDHVWMCRAPQLDECRVRRGEPPLFNMTFRQICNGIIDRLPDMNNDTDESGCPTSEWPCNTTYSICNHVWNCPDGRDELFNSCTGLSLHHCNDASHFCLDIRTGYPICLLIEKAGDGIVNCVGSIDEPSFCRIAYSEKFEHRFRCRNSDICITYMEICNCHQDCPENDDETIACDWVNNGRETLCDRLEFRCRDGKHSTGVGCYTEDDCEENENFLFCEFVKPLNEELFTVSNFDPHPSTSRSLLMHHQILHRSSTFSDFVVWHCNRGLHVRSMIDPPGFYCLCQQHYYGDRCQYQRKRIVLIVRLQSMSAFNTQQLSYKLVFLLVRNSTPNTIISHEQLIYASIRDCVPRYQIYLLYPMDDPSSSSFIHHSVHIHAFYALTLEHRVTWQFPIPFEFLPVRVMSKLLIIPENPAISESTIKKIHNTNCTSCSPAALCLGYDIDLDQEICVCPLNRTCRRCFVPFNPCTEKSCSGHGKCIPFDIRRQAEQQFFCVCNEEWYGPYCNGRKPRLHVSISREISIPTSKILFIHTMHSYDINEGLSFTYVHRLGKETYNFTFFLDNQAIRPTIGFIQFFEHRDQFDYYLLFLHRDMDQEELEVRTEIHPSVRCRSIQELFNETVVSQLPLRRVKNYQRVCLKNYKDETFRCFYDEKLMCLCDRTNHADCFNFQKIPSLCSEEWCHGRGICIQDHDRCPKTSVCICDTCSFGLNCQLTRAGYSLSLDAIIGSHILSTARSILYQTTVIQITVLIFGVLILFGIISNVLAIGTFTRRETCESGCSTYLFTSSCIGLLTMIVLMCKIIIILKTDQGDFSCSFVEFLLKWWPICCEWLNACVAIERTWVVLYPTNYSRPVSKQRAKVIVGFLLTCVALVCVPELIFRRMVVDTYDERAWCVLTLNADRRILLTLYSISNVLLFLIPIVINLISSVLIIQGTLRTKRRARPRNATDVAINVNASWKARFLTIKNQIIKHKNIIIAPILLGLLALPRLVFVFVFVCTKIDRKPYISLFTYWLAFVPSNAVLFAFVLPSTAYRAALSMFFKQFRTWCIQH